MKSSARKSNWTASSLHRLEMPSNRAVCSFGFVLVVGFFFPGHSISEEFALLRQKNNVLRIRTELRYDSIYFSTCYQSVSVKSAATKL